MTRLELLSILVGQARANGFELRRWYTTRLQLPWHGAREALQVLGESRHYYALLFSHEFAQSFWKSGQPITIEVAAQTFERLMPDGSVRSVERKPFMRRSGRPDAWRYHLRRMAVAEEPLRYIRRFLHIAENENPASEEAVEKTTRVLPPTLSLARKAHEKKKLGEVMESSAATKAKRGARLPGTRAKST